MPFTKTTFPGLLIYEPKVFEDERGYFFESYNQQTFNAEGVAYYFRQDNQAKSSYGVIRGLHYQLQPYAQTKLIRVLSGEILDVVVDIRKHSPTYAQAYTIMLSGDNKKQLLIPQGFAHGYAVLSRIAEVLYKCDNLYNKASEAGILYNDPALNIDWMIEISKAVISTKDKELPHFKDAQNNFVYSK